ncbi:DUF445 domain-containing protein [Clostridium formicaceticum]|uniref:DUF445 domain-containing protein n=1 Tax=Clostridium formicaceticum TaxID=1497 RepID=A0AAC9WFC7_9CLOT|nr:DUF445 family protein [Clostridium formicaceticum]AOY76380.1 hypothetical protein BJL90_10970 [Clostridium formicaceticum]ARE86772.1 hypothetical protein CLFO_11030 [Clostridium formicaceticum]
MNFLTIILLASIGAVIGWVTNLLAVKLLFRPFEPIEIPLLKLKLQGLIPKRRSEIAVSIGKTIETDLLSAEDIISKLVNGDNKEEIFLVIKNKISKIINERLPGIIPSSFKGMIQSYIDDIINKEGEKLVAEIVESIIEKSASSIQIAEMIEEKINDFPMDRLEEIVLNIAKNELKHIEILGGILGFAIGLLQGLIIILIQ